MTCDHFVSTADGCVLCDPDVPATTMTPITEGSITTPSTIAPVRPGARRGRSASIERRLCTASFADFFRAAWSVHEPSTPLSWGWALEAVCAHLQALVEDEDPVVAEAARWALSALPAAG